MAEKFDTKEFGWKDISVAYKGKIYEGIEECEYSKKQATDFLYGRGNDPHDIVDGNNEYEGKLSLWLGTIHQMEDDAPGGDITKLRGDIIVAYANDSLAPSRTDVLKNIKFSEFKKGGKQGDKYMKVELPFKYTKLLLNQ